MEIYAEGQWNEMEYHFKYFHFWALGDLETHAGFKDTGDEISWNEIVHFHSHILH